MKLILIFTIKRKGKSYSKLYHLYVIRHTDLGHRNTVKSINDLVTMTRCFLTYQLTTGFYIFSSQYSVPIEGISRRDVTRAQMLGSPLFNCLA